MQQRVVHLGASAATDEAQAVAELAAAIGRPDAALVLFFASSRYDLDRLAAALRATFSCPVLGCTTAGEIGGHGYVEGSLVGASFSAAALRVESRLIRQLAQFDSAQAEAVAASFADRALPPEGRRFGLLLVDGLSLCEEPTIAYLQHQLPGVEIVGGSAGDDGAFVRTHVYAEGAFHTDAAVLALFETALPFRVFRSQHFLPTAERMVITAADPSCRRVMEIDGVSAAEAYASLLGLTPAELGPGVFSRHPVLLRIGGQQYVRSIQRVDADGSLVFFCAIDEGLVLSLAEGVDLIESLDGLLGTLRQDVGELALVLGCDCILRRRELQERGLFAQAKATLAGVPFLGFSTYGEQIHGLHVNQTLTGVALGVGR